MAGRSGGVEHDFNFHNGGPGNPPYCILTTDVKLKKKNLILNPLYDEFGTKLLMNRIIESISENNNQEFSIFHYIYSILELRGTLFLERSLNHCVFFLKLLNQ